MKNKNLEGFYTYCLTTCGQKRLNKIKTTLRNCESIIGKKITNLEKKDVVNFLAKINQSDFKTWTKNDYKKIFKRFLKWYYEDFDLIESEEVKRGFRGVSGIKARNKEKLNETNLIQPHELELLIRTAKNLKWKALVSLLYESAFRPCEIANLKWKDITFDDSNNLARIFTISPKTKEDRKIPVKDCVVHLKRWLEEYQYPNRRQEDYVFPSQQDRNKPLAEGTITQMFKRISESAKIRKIYPYLLRHSRLHELQRKLPEKVVAKFGGHSIETSELYNHLGDDDVEKSMLEQVYVTKELTSEEKNKYEIEITKVNNRLDNALKERTLEREKLKKLQEEISQVRELLSKSIVKK